MFLQPKRTKYKKRHKGSKMTTEFRTVCLVKGTIGLKAAEAGIITARQLEAARRAISRKIQRGGRLWMCVYPSLPVTKKPTETRMGKGKGSVNHWAIKVKRGCTIFELCGLPPKLSVLAFNTGGNKLPIKTVIFS